MGIDPNVWGPSAWAIIHITAFQIKTLEQLRMARHMYYSFLHILPCEKCRKNFDTHLVSLPLPDKADDVGKWSFSIHARISGNDLTFRQAKHKWCNTPLTVQDALPLLESIAIVHPGAKAIDSVYRDSLFHFVSSFMYFLGSKYPFISKEDISSRSAFKLWLKRLKKKYTRGNIHRRVQECATSCSLSQQGPQVVS